MLGRDRESGQTEDRRGHVEAADEVAAPPRSDPTGREHHQRHVRDRIVETDVVEPDPVLSQGLAVVGRQDDQRAVRDAEAAESRPQLSELGVDVGHLAGVLREGEAHVADAVQPVREVLRSGTCGRMRSAIARMRSRSAARDAGSVA